MKYCSKTFIRHGLAEQICHCCNKSRASSTLFQMIHWADKWHFIVRVTEAMSGAPAGAELEQVIELFLVNLPLCQDQLSVMEKLIIRPHRFHESEYNVICEFVFTSDEF